MPGVSADGLAIDLRENVLTIEGSAGETMGEDERLVLREYETGSFRREFRLTNLIDQGGIDAALSNGVLRLTLPKAKAAQPRKIEVRTD
jgi:HSP20 family protein